MIFHNLGSISLVDLVRETDIVYIYVERERETQRDRETKQLEKKCGLTFACKT